MKNVFPGFITCRYHVCYPKDYTFCRYSRVIIIKSAFMFILFKNRKIKNFLALIYSFFLTTPQLHNIYNFLG